MRRRIRIWRFIVLDVDEKTVRRMARIFKSLRLLTPFGDEFKVCPETGQWRTTSVSPNR